MRPLALITSFALTAGAVAPVASAQTALPDSGARVRLRLHSDPEFIYQGVLLAPMGDSVIVNVPGKPALRVRRSDVRQLKVGKRGSRTPQTFAGIGIGLVAGGAFGAMVGSGSSDGFLGPEFAIAVGASIFGLVGGVTGGIIGYNRGGISWHDVPVSTRISPRGVGLSLAF